jgi:hypothetical protein
MFKGITLIASFILLALGAASQQLTVTAAEKAAITRTTKSFYSWYKTHASEFNSFNLYRNKKSAKIDGPPYMIDWKAVERFFTYIRTKVPQLGEAFIENERKDYKESQKNFDEDPEEEIAIGFDFDRIIGGQDDHIYPINQYVLSKLSKWSFKKTDAQTIMVTITRSFAAKDGLDAYTGHIKTQFKKEKGGWKISRSADMVEVDEYVPEEEKEIQPPKEGQ